MRAFLFISLLLLSARAAEIVWTRGPDLPLPRGGYQAAWHQGGLLLAGGTYWHDGKKFWTDRVSFYDPLKKQWQEREPLPRALSYGNLLNINGQLWLLGGSDEQTASLDIYKLQRQSWIKSGTTPAPFVYAATVVHDARIHLLGGGKNHPDLTTATTQHWAFDTRTGKWQQLAPVPGEPRVMHTAARIGDSIYVFGGLSQRQGEPYHNLGDAHRYNTRTARWHTLKPLPVPMRTMAAVSVERAIYLFGGYSDHPLDAVYRYDTMRDDYELIGHLPLRLMDAEFFYQGGKFYAASGEDMPKSRFAGLLIGRWR